MSTRKTLDEVIDEEESMAEAMDELGYAEEEASFLHADATERRRLAAIIKEEEAKEIKELEEWRNSLIIEGTEETVIKLKKGVDNFNP
jgi:hypothetical protein